MGVYVRYRCNSEDVSRKLEQVEKINTNIDGINHWGVGVPDRINLKKKKWKANWAAAFIPDCGGDRPIASHSCCQSWSHFFPSPFLLIGRLYSQNRSGK